MWILVDVIPPFVIRSNSVICLGLQQESSWRATFIIGTLAITVTGWWFGTCFMTFHILGIISPTDELIFFRGVETTNQIKEHELGNTWRAKVGDDFWSGSYSSFESTTNLQGAQIFVDNWQEGLCHGRCEYSLVRQVEKTWLVICHIMLLSIYLKLSGKKLLHFYRMPVKKEQYGSCHKWG